MFVELRGERAVQQACRVSGGIVPWRRGEVALVPWASGGETGGDWKHMGRHTLRSDPHHQITSSGEDSVSAGVRAHRGE